MLTKWAARKRAQRAIPTLKGMRCEVCGADKDLQRHHPDYRDLDRVEILCRVCHVKADQRDGHRRVKAARLCVICGTAFLPSHSKKHKTCSAECLSEIGRRNAMKRWNTSDEPSSNASTETTDCEH